MSFLDDLENLSIFTAGEFSDVGSVVSPTALYSQISGIFDENVEVMLGLGGIDSSVGGRNFSFKVETEACDGLRYGDSIAIKGKNFQITSIDPYGDGKMTDLKLKETAFVSPTSDSELVEASGKLVEAGESLPQYHVVTRIDGKLYLADALSINKVRAFGLMQQNVASGDNGSVKYAGHVSNSSWDFDPSKGLYLGAFGTMIQFPAPFAVAHTSMGVVLSPTEILLDISDPIYLDLDEQ